MIRPCSDADFDAIYAIINDAAQAYCGVIPADCWHIPYMSQEYLRHEIDGGVRFFGWEEGCVLVGVMGIQDVQDVTLIRHAYVRTTSRNGGIGGKLLGELRTLTTRPVLIGTWAAATWAIRFYEKHGFQMVTPEEKDRLLKEYWSISKRQIETSVVLGDHRWFAESKKNSLAIDFRWATPVDAGLLGEMNRQLIIDEGHRNRMSVSELEKRMAGWLKGEYEAVIFEREHEPLGYVLFKRESEWVYVRHFFVRPKHRRQGIGRTAFAWLASNAWESCRIRLDVLVGNSTGIAFWRSLGFSECCLTMELDNGR